MWIKHQGSPRLSVEGVFLSFVMAYVAATLAVRGDWRCLPFGIGAIFLATISRPSSGLVAGLLCIGCGMSWGTYDGALHMASNPLGNVPDWPLIARLEALSLILTIALAISSIAAAKSIVSEHGRTVSTVSTDGEVAAENLTPSSKKQRDRLLRPALQPVGEKRLLRVFTNGTSEDRLLRPQGGSEDSPCLLRTDSAEINTAL